MNAIYQMAALFLAGGLSVVLAAMPTLAGTNPSMTVTFNWRIISPTCEFKESVQSVILDDIPDRAFTDTGVRNATPFTVGITCASGVESVKIVPTGTPDTKDTTAFDNTGTAGNVALRLMDKDGNTLLPDGRSNVAVTLESQKGSYTFSAGYVATAAGQVTPGRLASSVTLSFEYD